MRTTSLLHVRKAYVRFVVAVGACLAAGVLGSDVVATAKAPPHAVATGQVSVLGSPRLPNGSTDLGKAVGVVLSNVEVVLTLPNVATLDALATNLSTPSSREYRQFLTTQEFATEYGPRAPVINAVKTYLSSVGLTVGSVSANGLFVHVSGRVLKIDSAFGVTIDWYEAPGVGKFMVPTSTPSVPTSLGSDVSAVLGLDSLSYLTPYGRLRPSLARNRPSRSARAAGSCGPDIRQTGAASPDDISNAYGFGAFSKAHDDGGPTVAVVEFGSFKTADISTYGRCELIKPTLGTTSLDGGGNPGPGTFEAEGDIEDVLSLAPDDVVHVYEAPNSTLGYLDTINQIASDDTAAVVDIGWGACELRFPAAAIVIEQVLFAEAAIQGQTVLAASGDSGATGCGTDTHQPEVAYPAGAEFITTVGGTTWPDFHGTDSVTRPTRSEAAWVDSGGGIAWGTPRPAWQTPNASLLGISERCRLSNERCREAPDLSALAGDPGYAVYCSASPCAAGSSNITDWYQGFGTSFATATVAAMTSLVDAATPGSRIGLFGPMLYQRGLLSTNGVLGGNNNAAHQSVNFFTANDGYNLVTGLGTPVGSQWCWRVGLAACQPQATPVVTTKSIVFTVITGNDDLRSDSEAIAEVFLHGGGTFSVVLHFSGQPSWSNGETHRKSAPIPSGVSLTQRDGIAGAELQLVQGGSGTETPDDWDVDALNVSLFPNTLASGDGVCQLNLAGSQPLPGGGTGLVRLSQSAGSSGSGPDSPEFMTGSGSGC